MHVLDWIERRTFRIVLAGELRHGTKHSVSTTACMLCHLHLASRQLCGALAAIKWLGMCL